MDTLEHIFTIYSVLFILYMYARWSKDGTVNILIKTSLVLLGLLGIIIELKALNVL